MPQIADRRVSIYFILGIIVTFVVTAVMSGFFVYSYIDKKNTLYGDLKTNSQITLNRLTKSLPYFIESYSMNEYEKLIINEMGDKAIYAILLEDSLMAEILGESIFISGKIRSENWNVENYVNKKERFLNESFFNVESIIKSHEGNDIGKIKIYYTDKFLKYELKSLEKRSIFITLSVSFLLIIFLFYAIKKYILLPIEDIVNTVSKRSEEGLPHKTISINGAKEIEQLSNSLNDMIDTIKISKDQLKKLNERFELTLDAVKDGIWDWDIKSDKAYFSKRWKGMLGFEDDEIKNNGKAFFDLIHPDDQKKVKEAINLHFKDPKKYPYNLEIRLRTKQGGYRWILSRGEVIFNENNEPFRMLGYHTDITHEKENEENLKKQQQIMQEQSKLASMGEMIGNIAHQWRQPLSVISTGATGLKVQNEYKVLTDEILNSTCDLINNNAQYLSKTIDDFRDFIKGNQKPQEFYLKDMVDSFLRLVEGSIKKYDIDIELKIDENLKIIGFENQLMQCILNIFNNSKDAFLDKNKKVLIIEVFEKDAKAVIKITDNGGGIPLEILPKIFEPYFTTKHQSKGTGLGLHMTYNLIVKGMSGSIGVNNVSFEYKNKTYKGASFEIGLPLKIKQTENNDKHL